MMSRFEIILACVCVRYIKKGKIIILFVLRKIILRLPRGKQKKRQSAFALRTTLISHMVNSLCADIDILCEFTAKDLEMGEGR